MQLIRQCWEASIVTAEPVETVIRAAINAAKVGDWRPLSG